MTDKLLELFNKEWPIKLSKELEGSLIYVLDFSIAKTKADMIESGRLQIDPNSILNYNWIRFKDEDGY